MAPTTTTQNLTLVAFGPRSKTAHLCEDAGDDWRSLCGAPLRKKKGAILFPDNKLPEHLETCVDCIQPAAGRLPGTPKASACSSHGKINCRRCASKAPEKGNGVQPEGAPAGSDDAVAQHKEDLELDVCEQEGTLIDVCNPAAHKAWHARRRKAKVKDAVAGLDPVAHPIKADLVGNVELDEGQDVHVDMPGVVQGDFEVAGIDKRTPGRTILDLKPKDEVPPPGLEHAAGDLNDTLDGTTPDPPAAAPRRSTPPPRALAEVRPAPGGGHAFEIPLHQVSAAAVQALLGKVVEQERELAVLRARFPTSQERQLLQKVLGRIFRGDKLDARRPPYTEEERNTCAILYAKVAIPDARASK
jgi:hypothetical protein